MDLWANRLFIFFSTEIMLAVEEKYDVWKTVFESFYIQTYFLNVDLYTCTNSFLTEDVESFRSTIDDASLGHT